jgi:hypothetical protein
MLQGHRRVPTNVRNDNDNADHTACNPYHRNNLWLVNIPNITTSRAVPRVVS